MGFLRPNKGKLWRAGVFAAFLLLCVLMEMVPRAWDPIDLHEFTNGVLMVAFLLPIVVFNRLTNSAFAGHSEVPVFQPSNLECVVALLFSAVACYLLGCVWYRLRRKREPVAAAAE